MTQDIQRVTLEQMEENIKEVQFSNIGGTHTICLITVNNGFTFLGDSACVDPNNFSKDVGEKIAYDNAIDKMWGYYGFLLKQKMYETTLTNSEE